MTAMRTRIRSQLEAVGDNSTEVANLIVRYF